MTTKVLRLNAAELETLEAAAAELDSLALDIRLCNATGPAHAPRFDSQYEAKSYAKLRKLSAELRTIHERGR